ncbi:hypothetical protein Tco_0849106 [Tanacetum coccineum]
MHLEESLESTQERIAYSWGAMEASKRRRSMLDYIIQQLSKGLSEGSGIIPDFLDEPKDNFGSSSSSLSGSNDDVQDIQSMVDVPIHQTDPVVQRTPLIDIVISMVTEKTTSTPTSPTTQAQVTNVSEYDSSSKFEAKTFRTWKDIL